MTHFRLACVDFTSMSGEKYYLQIHRQTIQFYASFDCSTTGNSM